MSNLLLIVALALATELPADEQSDTQLASQEIIITCHQDGIPYASGMPDASVYLLDVNDINGAYRNRLAQVHT